MNLGPRYSHRRKDVNGDRRVLPTPQRTVPHLCHSGRSPGGNFPVVWLHLQWFLLPVSDPLPPRPVGTLQTLSPTRRCPVPSSPPYPGPGPTVDPGEGQRTTTATLPRAWCRPLAPGPRGVREGSGRYPPPAAHCPLPTTHVVGGAGILSGPGDTGHLRRGLQS